MMARGTEQGGGFMNAAKQRVFVSVAAMASSFLSFGQQTDSPTQPSRLTLQIFSEIPCGPEKDDRHREGGKE